jgi:hypothetical protein
LLFDFGRFELFLERANALDRFLLVLPVGFETARGFAQIFDLAFQLPQPLFRRFVFFALERLALDFELENFALHLVDFDRHAIDFNAQPRRRFIDQIDRFVGQKAVADIAVRQSRGADDRAVGDAHAVMYLVAFFEAAQIAIVSSTDGSPT